VLGMLRIGELARLGGVSVKALRFYDEIGLLVPAEVDRDSGYRLYAAAQLATLRSVVALKDAGLPLQTIAELVADPAGLRDRLAEHRDRLLHDAAEARRRIARVDALLAAGSCDVVVRETPRTPAAAVRERLTRYEDLDDALLLGAPHAPADARRAALWHRCDDGEIEGQALFLGDRVTDSRGPLAPIVLPRQRVATAVYAGDEWAPAYLAIRNWMECNGYALAGPKREEFVTAEITEVLVPIRQEEGNA
jgi:DNA-binding transcriptional MerR regulator